ncbi:MAG: hypothetical protein ACLFPE_02635 [Bacteroidales bacterium]
MNHKPVYKRFIDTLQRGFAALDDDAQRQTAAFLKNQLHPDGGFRDRAGNPDPYYSVFGMLISKALHETELLYLLKLWAFNDRQITMAGQVDEISLQLIRTLLKPEYRGASWLYHLRTMVSGKGSVDAAYHLFLLLLLMDVQNKNRSFPRLILKIALRLKRPTQDLPCSATAAWLFARKELGLEFRSQTGRLMKYYREGSGFVSYRDSGKADLLSSAVAAFVLAESGADLNTVRKDCLELLEQNYDRGAFLSGEGDAGGDTEYTFYGLLLLGSLMKNE